MVPVHGDVSELVPTCSLSGLRSWGSAALRRLGRGHLEVKRGMTHVVHPRGSRQANECVQTKAVSRPLTPQGIGARALYPVPTYADRCREVGVRRTTVRVDLLDGVVHTLNAQRGVLQRDSGLGADSAHVRDQDVGAGLGQVRRLVCVEHVRRRSLGRTVSRPRQGRRGRQRRIGTNK